MEIMDGKNLSNIIKDDLRKEISMYVQTPILAVITIGDDEASKVYVNNKRKSCEQVGISFMHFDYLSEVKESVVINKIKELNKDVSVNGIIVQLPIPDHFNVDKIINTIDVSKDVDGLTNESKIRRMNNKSSLIPCTTKGILELLDYYKINIESKRVVVVGRSELVGTPTYQECLKRNATVTICHSKTIDLGSITKEADILIVATGHKYLIDKNMIKEGCVIIDVGISRDNGKLYGDVNPNVSDKCSYLTPVPGGVGPMTVVMLLKNTFIAYKSQHGVKDV
ncbi:bifunctional protein FolD [Clostridium sp. CAG:1000]|mgnify:FL=1|jgi:methylenetetrahydrofolate dehydrogenase (NADP+)/methenyltetrahydrofolate cyclohydrolase|nr:bifunctional protein FolD [Clostridium sp. CAG:1000]